MYRVLMYDETHGWLVVSKHSTHVAAHEEYSRLRDSHSDEVQFDIAYMPSKRKPRKKVSA